MFEKNIYRKKKQQQNWSNKMQTLKYKDKD